jgi:hypothetical protein
MKLAVFLSDLRRTEDTYERLKAEKLGVILVENGIYHAVMKEGGKDSPVLSKAGEREPEGQSGELRGHCGPDHERLREDRVVVSANTLKSKF